MDSLLTSGCCSEMSVVSHGSTRRSNRQRLEQLAYLLNDLHTIILLERNCNIFFGVIMIPVVSAIAWLAGEDITASTSYAGADGSLSSTLSP